MTLGLLLSSSIRVVSGKALIGDICENRTHQAAQTARAKALHDFVNDEVLPRTGLSELDFWVAFDDLLGRLMPELRALLARRDRLQTQIDESHRVHALKPFNVMDYKKFLIAIGYLSPKGRISPSRPIRSIRKCPPLPGRSLSCR